MQQITASHFDGHKNLTPGQRLDGDSTLGELLTEVATTLNGQKKGRVVVAAPGDIAVAFATAYADASYTVTGLAFEDTTGGVHADLDVKSGTKLAAGFTVTVAGVGAAGILHWSTSHD